MIVLGTDDGLTRRWLGSEWGCQRVPDALCHGERLRFVRHPVAIAVNTAEGAHHPACGSNSAACDRYRLRLVGHPIAIAVNTAEGAGHNASGRRDAGWL